MRQKYTDEVMDKRSHSRYVVGTTLWFIFTVTCCSGATSRLFTFMVSPLSSKKYKVLTPVPKRMSLFRNSIFCRQSSSDQVKVWGKVLIQYGWHHKKGEFGHRYVHREDQVKTEWKLSTTKGIQRWLEARWEGGEDSLSQLSERNSPDFKLLTSRTMR